jgi:signal transduction histidine kinase
LKYTYLQNFRSLDSDTFAALMRHLGFQSAVCYRFSGEALVQVLSSEAEAQSGWPAAVSLPDNYTPAGDGTPLLGWVRLQDLPINRKVWPKGANLYFPEQELSDERVVLGVVNASGKRSRSGDLVGPLEAICGRIRGWFRDQTERQQMSEAGIREHLRRLGVDLQMLLDHELRTPMASVSGYASLLRELDPAQDAAAFTDYVDVLVSETGNALAAIEKLSLALHADRGFGEPPAMEAFDAADEARLLCDRLKERAPELVGEDAARRTRIKFQKATDQSCTVRADRGLFSWAVWEVLKNAAAHSRSGRVAVNIYTSDRMLVIDVEDDGMGISPGSEELIFLRFYQDPGNQHMRRGKRGLGLGLFLARHIVERHLGRLTFIRQRSATLFRFVWPLPPDGTENGGKAAPVIRLPRGA